MIRPKEITPSIEILRDLMIYFGAPTSTGDRAIDHLEEYIKALETRLSSYETMKEEPTDDN